jgi:hypothetical protein
LFDPTPITLGLSPTRRSWSPLGARISLSARHYCHRRIGDGVDLDDPRAASVFAHELLHVWQRQHGRRVTFEGACLQVPYMLGGKSPYRYAFTRDADAMLSTFLCGNIEQQGQMFQDYVFRDRTGKSTAPYASIAAYVRGSAVRAAG